MMREFDERSRAFFELVLPAVDMYELSGSLVIEVDMPGFSRENINLKATQSTLHISAKRERNKDVDTFYISQRPLRIRKTLRLPVDVDTATEPNAKYENGVLTVSLPIKGAKSIRIQ